MQSMCYIDYKNDQTTLICYLLLNKKVYIILVIEENRIQTFCWSCEILTFQINCKHKLLIQLLNRPFRVVIITRVTSVGTMQKSATNYQLLDYLVVYQYNYSAKTRIS